MNRRAGITEGSSFSGTLYTAAAFSMWGVLPGYWKQLQNVPAGEIVLHRIVWSCVTVMLFVFLTGRQGILSAIVRNRKQRVRILAASVTIGLNWFTYVFAVNAGYIVEASLGYFINPLVSIFLGMAVLKERLSPMQAAALFLACAAVIYQTLSFGRFPWIAFALAFSFGLYGLVKKTGGLEPMTALGLETFFLLPIALPVLFMKGLNGTAAFGGLSFSTTVLLAGSGIVSAAPLFCFANGAGKIPLSRVGFLQYIAPSLMLVIGVTVYGEPFTGIHMVSFSLIWAALLIYSVSGIMEMRKAS